MKKSPNTKKVAVKLSPAVLIANVNNAWAAFIRPLRAFGQSNTARNVSAGDRRANLTAALTACKEANVAVPHGVRV